MKKRTTETNTLALIRNWTMAGARGDLDGHFASPVDIHALVGERAEAPAGTPGRPALLLKSPDEDDWQPLLVEHAA